MKKFALSIKNACGFDVAYAYNDLVFAERGLFIIQFPKNETKKLECWFNNDCDELNNVSLFNSLAKMLHSSV